ncbi:hypothetical protein P872_15850 [Rhodonellum psychrophilum GCM71 = DSM 17998]|uniref:PKD domain-containing protein n=2 Tax=Rhodonellum TaxID=336827 RepID=U5BUE9_9BACT|nr:hypothetical protein P872_15850 [Rhodonellum psychrophilum GCM71 = DSM 17998]
MLLGLSYFNVAHAQISTVGREFYLGFMENNRIEPNRPDLASIVISANEDAAGVIQYTNATIEFSLAAGEQFVYKFPVDGLDIIHRTSGLVENKGVYIGSSGNIAVHAFNFRDRSADGTIILPLASLGKDYWVTAHQEDFAPGVLGGGNVNFESTLLVIAIEDNTDIVIVPASPTVNTIPAGAPINVTLNKGQSYQIKGTRDLTGSRVSVVGSDAENCKNIVVFGGNKMTSIGTDCEGTTGDHLFQQIYPTFAWGKEYIHIPFKGRTSGEMIKVLASENNTQVFVNGDLKSTLNAGKFVSFVFGQDEFANITTSKPTAVTAFAKSQGCNIQNGPLASLGDPSMVTYSPNPQLIKRVVFSAVSVVGIVNHYVNVITKTSGAANTLLDGSPIGGQFLPVPGNPEYAFAQVEISSGSHTLSNPEGLIGYVYGSGFIESYAYAAGASLNNLNFETEVEYDFEVEGDKVACLGETGSWTAIPQNPLFEIFEWTFGDGTPMQEGKTVNHKFENAGTYQVKIVALSGDRSCNQIEEAFFEVNVVETSGEIEGPENVCPLIDESLYVFENPENTARVDWEVEGGEITEATDFSVRILWGNANPDAKVRAIPITQEGCRGVPVLFEVFVNESIVPGLAKGPDQICFLKNEKYSYQVKDLVNDRKYKWFVEGGILLSGGTEPEVEIQWSGVGTEGLIWYEEFSELNPSCGGVSKKLVVKVNPPMEATVKEITDFICFGSGTGKIEVEAKGGSGIYTYEWSHDSTLNAPLADQLPAGIYQLKVSDAGGCEVIFESLSIQESSEMELFGEIQTTPATCFISADGTATIKIIGGLPPYTINTTDAISLSNEIQVFNLIVGEYSLSVFDQLNCEFPISFSIASPPPLSAEFEVARFPCPGFSNGNLLATPQGGVGPYTLSWLHDGTSGISLTGISSGNYGLNITDARGCSQIVYGEMRETAPQVRMPTGFNPLDGLFQGVSNCDISFQLMVFNKWGELIYVGTQGWDGKVKGNVVPTGTYTYLTEYSFTLENEIQNRQIRGVFTLINN